MDKILNEQVRPRLFSIIFRIFLCGLAIFSIVGAAHYWLRMIGYFPGDLWRIDLMPTQWQVLSVTLACIYPVAAVGLWLASRWGGILWSIAAIVEIICYGPYASYFIANPTLVIVNVILLIVLLLGTLVYWWENRRQNDYEADYI